MFIIFYQQQVVLNCKSIIFSFENVLIKDLFIFRDTQSLRQYLVKVGSSYIDQGTIYPVFQIKLNERYIKYEYDIAMVTVRVPLVLGPSVNSIPIGPDNFKVGLKATAIGWSSQATSKDFLQQVPLPYVQPQLCRQLYSEITTITDNMICAGDIATGGIGACTGSFGGPLVYEGKLVGISSFSNGCAQMGYPTVFTKVSTLKDWIMTNAKTVPKV